MEICRLTTVFAMVGDMADATRFVETATGLEPTYASAAWTEFDTGAAHFALHLSARPPASPGDGGGAPGSMHVSLTVGDLAGALARLRSRGFAPTEPEHLEGMTALSSRVAGPDGINLHLVQA